MYIALSSLEKGWDKNGIKKKIQSSNIRISQAHRGGGGEKDPIQATPDTPGNLLLITPPEGCDSPAEKH